MTVVEVNGDSLLIHVQGWDRLWAFKSELRVPLEHVVNAERAEQEASTWFHGLRAPGTNVPGIITAGTFYGGDGRAFWDVHDPRRAIAIRLRDDRYAKLIIEVEHPDETIQRIMAAI